MTARIKSRWHGTVVLPHGGQPRIEVDGWVDVDPAGPPVRIEAYLGEVRVGWWIGWHSREIAFSVDDVAAGREVAVYVYTDRIVWL